MSIFQDENTSFRAPKCERVSQEAQLQQSPDLNPSLLPESLWDVLGSRGPILRLKIRKFSDLGGYKC